MTSQLDRIEAMLLEARRVQSSRFEQLMWELSRCRSAIHHLAVAQGLELQLERTQMSKFADFVKEMQGQIADFKPTLQANTDATQSVALVVSKQNDLIKQLQDQLPTSADDVTDDDLQGIRDGLQALRDGFQADATNELAIQGTQIDPSGGQPSAGQPSAAQQPADGDQPFTPPAGDDTSTGQ